MSGSQLFESQPDVRTGKSHACGCRGRCVDPSCLGKDFEVLTLSEACQLLRISKPTMFNLLARKAIPARKVGRCWRFQRSAVINWFNGNPASRTFGGKR